MSAHTDNSIFVDADLEFVWTMTNDLESWPNLFTEYASVETLERGENRFLFRLTMHPDENGQVWSWVSERVLDPEKHKAVAHRVETGPFEYMNIEWTYEVEGAGTRMRWVQDFHMRPTAPVNDEQMANNINTNTPIQMNVIREKVEQASRAAPAAAVPRARP